MIDTILPPNSTPLEHALDSVGAVRIAAVPVPLRDLWSATRCPEPLLPWLAQTVGITSWDAATPLALRRARVAKSIAIQHRKGTVQSVRDVIASYGGIVVLSEWWQQQPRGRPRTFSLSITLGGQSAAPSGDFINAVIDDVIQTKPEGATFTFTVALNALGAVAIARAARLATFARLTCREA